MADDLAADRQVVGILALLGHQGLAIVVILLIVTRKSSWLCCRSIKPSRASASCRDLSSCASRSISDRFKWISTSAVAASSGSPAPCTRSEYCCSECLSSSRRTSVQSSE